MDTIKPNQEKYIKDLHPDVQQKFRDFVKLCGAQGWDIICTSGYRSFEEQRKLNKLNPSNAKAGRSHHNYGLALDINAVRKGVQLRKASTEKAWNDSGIPEIAKQLGISWQYAFGTYKDPVHFFIKHDTSVLLQRAIKQFGSEDKIIGNRVNLFPSQSSKK